MAMNKSAVITSLDGPVVRARTDAQFSINEAVDVGEHGLLGEVLRIAGDVIVVQVYEDTAGLQIGDRVQGSGRPLAAPLGPWLLGGIFDGLLRPLSAAAGVYVRPGKVQREIQSFKFEARIKPGDAARAGNVLGQLESQTGKKSLLLVPPDVHGQVTEISGAGTYGDDAVLCKIKQTDGSIAAICMTQTWPVRIPRPAAQRLAPQAPLLTGQRIIDALFPVARGSSAAMPGGFGTGKTILQQSIAKWCDADVIVYVGCGERGNEMAEVLDEFPKIEDPRTGRPLHGALGDHRQHLQHAGGGARGQHLHRRDGSGIFSRSGPARGADGGLYQPLGGGSARTGRTPGRAAGGGRLSGLSRQPPGRIL